MVFFAFFLFHKPRNDVLIGSCMSLSPIIHIGSKSSENLHCVTEGEPGNTSVKMAGSRVRTHHLPNTRLTHLRTSDIVTGMQIFFSLILLSYLTKPTGTLC